MGKWVESRCGGEQYLRTEIQYPRSTRGYYEVDLRLTRSELVSISSSTLVPRVEGTTHGGILDYPLVTGKSYRAIGLPVRYWVLGEDWETECVEKGAR